MENRIADLEQEIKLLRKEVKELHTLNKEVLQLFNNNVKAIRMSEGMKEKGPGNPRYRPDVKNGQVIEDYINNEHHITNSMIEKYGMTYQGLRLRLKSAGVLKDKEKDAEK